MNEKQETSVQLQPSDLPAIYRLFATHPKFIRRNLALACAAVIVVIHGMAYGISWSGVASSSVVATLFGIALYWLGGTGWHLPNPNRAARERFREALLRPQLVSWDQQGISSKSPVLELRYHWADLRSWRATGRYMLIYGKDGLLFPVTADDGNSGMIDNVIELLQANGVKGGRV